MTTMPPIKYIQLFLVVLILGFLAGPHVIEALQRMGPDGNTPMTAEVGATQLGSSQTSGLSIPKPEDPYKKLPLHATGVYVWDVNTHRKLFDMNGGARLPLASVAKIMMALVAIETLPPETKITVTSSDILGEGDTGLNVGEVWKFEKLLQFTLVASSNDGAGAIAETAGRKLDGATSTSRAENKKIFIQKMNDRAQTLGLSETSFQNESGLDLSTGVSGAYGSARDMAMLFEYVFRKHPEIFTSTASAELDLRSENNVVHHVANTNRDVDHITGLIGSKTGYTDLAGGNLVVVVDIGISHPIVIAVLGSTREDRFGDVKQLIAAATTDITHPLTSAPDKN